MAKSVNPERRKAAPAQVFNTKVEDGQVSKGEKWEEKWHRGGKRSKGRQWCGRRVQVEDESECACDTHTWARAWIRGSMHAHCAAGDGVWGMASKETGHVRLLRVRLGPRGSEMCVCKVEMQER